MKMKWVLIPVLALIVAFVAFIGWYRWDSGRNRGYTFGYYGEFNTVSNALAAISDVNIINSGYNADITLEEFGFTILLNGEQELKIWFSETDPVRKMSGEKLAWALMERVSKESSNKTN